MKIYSDRITEDDVKFAFHRARMHNHADIRIQDIITWTPRNQAYGTELHAVSDNGRRAVNRGTGGRAASWEDWGFVIAYLYRLDPEARIGIYTSRADFRNKVHQYQRPGSSLAFLDILQES
jgi:hypothetical protein